MSERRRSEQARSAYKVEGPWLADDSVGTGDGGGTPSPRSFHELFAGNLVEFPELVQFVPAFQLLVDDLAHLTDNELKARALEVFPKLALWMLRDARHAEQFMASLPVWAENLAEAKRAPNGMAALRVLFRYLLLVKGEVSWQDIRAKVHALAPSVEPEFMSIADQLMDMGRAEGLDKGLAKGRVDLLTKLLTLKFGELPEQHRARLTCATVDELDGWAERVLTATTLDQVFVD